MKKESDKSRRHNEKKSKEAVAKKRKKGKKKTSKKIISPSHTTQATIEVQDKPRKVYVLDTSALIEDHECIVELAQGGNIVVIPKPVIHELDNLKNNYKKSDEVREEAHAANTLIYDLREERRVNYGLEGILRGDVPLERCNALPNGGYVFWERNYTLPEDCLDRKHADNIILGTALLLANQSRNAIVTLISEDKNLILKADAEGAGIQAEKLKMGKEELKEGHYKGYFRAFVDRSVIEEFYNSGPAGMRSIPFSKIERNSTFHGKKKKGPFYWNEGVILIDSESNEEYLLTKVAYDGQRRVLRELTHSMAWNDGSKNPEKKGYHPTSLLGFKPGDPLQTFALEYILDPTVELVVLDGKAGTGKTRLMMTASVRMLIELTELEKQLKKVKERLGFEVPNYSRGLIISRPEFSATGFEVGTLPGDHDEKMAPWVLPYVDALNRLKTDTHENYYETLRRNGMFSILATSELRGINIENVISLMDEAQNGDRHLAKTYMSRFARTAKGIVAGDITQIDNRFVGPRNNALTLIRENYKTAGPEVAMITLEKNYRGKISKLAEKM